MAGIKIYDFPLAFNPPKATLAAAEKGIKYDRVTLNIFTADHMRPEFLRISKAGTVPCLVDGEKVVTSSREIVEYLDNKDGKPLGGTAVDRAAVATWMDKIDAWDGNLFASYSVPENVKAILASANWYKEKVILEESAKHPELKDVYDQRLAAMKATQEEYGNPENVENNKTGLRELLQDAEKQLQSQPFLAGTEYSAADILFTPVLFRVTDMGKAKDYLSDKPNVSKYFEKIGARPSFSVVYGPAKSPWTMVHLVLGGVLRIQLKKLVGI